MMSQAMNGSRFLTRLILNNKNRQSSSQRIFAGMDLSDEQKLNPFSLIRRSLLTPQGQLDPCTQTIQAVNPYRSLYYVRRFSGCPGNKRPFRVLGIQQIAVGSLNKGALTHLWGDLFGLELVGQYISEKENVDEDIYMLPDGTEVDLMAPLDLEKSPKVHSPALNHIGLWVDDLETAVKWLSENCSVRFTPGGIRKGASGHDVAFIHPKGSENKPIGGVGVLIELVQAPTSIILKFS